MSVTRSMALHGDINLRRQKHCKDAGRHARLTPRLIRLIITMQNPIVACSRAARLLGIHRRSLQRKLGKDPVRENV